MSLDLNSSSAIISSVQNYYGKVLKKTEDLRTSACTVGACSKNGSLTSSPLYRSALVNVPEDVASKFYGCGNPVPLGISGLRVLDLGSGSGRDCYIAAQFAG